MNKTLALATMLDSNLKIQTGYLPTATTSALGGVKVDGTTITINGSGVISSSNYTLPTATTSALGGVKVDGTTITINGSGVISSTNITGSALAIGSYAVASANVAAGTTVAGSTYGLPGTWLVNAFVQLPINLITLVRIS